MRIKYKIIIVYIIFSILFCLLMLFYLYTFQKITKYEGNIQYNFFYSILSALLSFFTVSILIIPITDNILIKKHSIEKILFYKLHLVFFLRRWNLKRLIREIKSNNNLDGYVNENNIPNNFYSKIYGIIIFDENGINYSNKLIPWNKIYNWFYFESPGKGWKEEYILIKYNSKFDIPQKLKLDLKNDINDKSYKVLISLIINNIKFGKEESLI